MSRMIHLFAFALFAAGICSSSGCVGITNGLDFGVFGVPIPVSPFFQEQAEDMPLLARLHFHILHIITGQDEDYHMSAFRVLLEEWKSNVGDGSQKMLSELYQHLINHYTRKVNRSEDVEAIMQLYELYKTALARGHLASDGTISMELFNAPPAKPS